MEIDIIGGIRPPNKNKSVSGSKSDYEDRPIEKKSIKDKIDISKEALKLAETNRTKSMVLSHVDVERSEKIREVRERLNANEYEQLNSNQLNEIADSVMRVILK